MGSSFMHTLALFPAHGVIIGSLEINGDSGLIFIPKLLVYARGPAVENTP